VRLLSQGRVVDVIPYVLTLDLAVFTLNFITDIGLRVVFAPIINGQLVCKEDNFNLCSSYVV